MTKQFTTNEVRDLSRKIAIALVEMDARPPKDEHVMAALNALADLLEAQEKAVPVMVVNHVSSAEHDLPIGMKLYAHPVPADADRLAEALHNLVSEWVAIADDGDATLEDSTIGYRACANRLSAMLAAHTAQAQPPAASVPNGLIDALRHQLQIDECGDEVGVSRQAVDEAIAILTMLAAQENPNG